MINHRINNQNNYLIDRRKIDAQYIILVYNLISQLFYVSRVCICFIWLLNAKMREQLEIPKSQNSKDNTSIAR